MNKEQMMSLSARRTRARGCRPQRNTRWAALLFVLLLLLPAGTLWAGTLSDSLDSAVRHVILVSVDGLRPDAITRHSPDELPNFYRLRAEGAFTDNARTDYDYSITLPNHMAQLTGRPVLGPEGHNWTSNNDPRDGETLHSNKGAYVASAFDVAHDAGMRTGAYVSKSKFILLHQSYGQEHGAPDVTGEDDGRDKIDEFAYEEDTETLVSQFIQDMQADPFGFAFVHLRDPDSNGHSRRFSVKKNSSYMEAVRKVDGLLGEILDMVETDPKLAGNTVVIVTADHGGGYWSHSSASDEENYTIPFYVWGTGVPQEDLYELNAGTYANPGSGRPGYDAALQPIRNGDAGNLALALLGLGSIPSSMLNFAGDLTVTDTPVLMTDRDTTRSTQPVHSGTR